jgi:hypothetical protein
MAYQMITYINRTYALKNKINLKIIHLSAKPANTRGINYMNKINDLFAWVRKS